MWEQYSKNRVVISKQKRAKSVLTITEAHMKPALGNL